ncbi:MAG: cell division protein ZapA [Alphaproteobacteria bacterium]|nr:cell division protein ZapA [Alphaproteobacteria bacterium]
MGQALLTIAGRSYRIPARDGDEARIARLGDELSARAQRLTTALGVLPENQLLVLIALMLADELADGHRPAPAAQPAGIDLLRLAALVERLEAIART